MTEGKGLAMTHSLPSLRGEVATKQSHAPPGLPRLPVAMTGEKGRDDSEQGLFSNLSP